MHRPQFMPHGAMSSGLKAAGRTFLPGFTFNMTTSYTWSANAELSGAASTHEKSADVVPRPL